MYVRVQRFSCAAFLPAPCHAAATVTAIAGAVRCHGAVALLPVCCSTDYRFLAARLTDHLTPLIQTSPRPETAFRRSGRPSLRFAPLGFLWWFGTAFVAWVSFSGGHRFQWLQPDKG